MKSRQSTNSEFENSKREVDRFFDRAMNKTGGMILLEKLTDVETYVVLVFHTLGLAMSKGFSDFLEDEYDDDPGYKKTLKSFRRIGATAAAKIILEAMDLKKKEAKRKKPFHRTVYYPLDERFENLAQTVVIKLRKYIVANR